MKHIKRGLVKKSTGSWYEIITESGESISCCLQGKIRLKGSKSTNPVAVGDMVEYDESNKTIKQVCERKNYLIRRSNNLSKYSHIIAANIDLALLIISFKQPRTSQGFIDRFLLTCEAYDIEVCIVLNKNDLLTPEEKLVCADFLAMYENIGYKTFNISVKNESDNQQILDLILDKHSLFAGHSGVGKSSLINNLMPLAGAKTGIISEAHFKGKHTTTFAEMYQLTPTTYLIDTPGIKDFGLVSMEKAEVSHYFREMLPYVRDCRFANCLHQDEPGCAVIKAVEEGNISPNRYYSYLNIQQSDTDINTPDYIWRRTL